MGHGYHLSASRSYRTISSGSCRQTSRHPPQVPEELRSWKLPLLDLGLGRCRSPPLCLSSDLADSLIAEGMRYKRKRTDTPWGVLTPERRRLELLITF